eukprot:850545-Pleurochrysis_carterae.AAC.1
MEGADGGESGSPLDGSACGAHQGPAGAAQGSAATGEAPVTREPQETTPFAHTTHSGARGRSGAARCPLKIARLGSPVERRCLQWRAGRGRGTP